MISISSDGSGANCCHLDAPPRALRPGGAGIKAARSRTPACARRGRGREFESESVKCPQLAHILISILILQESLRGLPGSVSLSLPGGLPWSQLAWEHRRVVWAAICTLCCHCYRTVFESLGGRRSVQHPPPTWCVATRGRDHEPRCSHIWGVS